MEAFDYIQAAKGSRLLDRDETDRLEMIRGDVERAFTLRGLAQPSGSDFQFIVNEVAKKVSTAYPYMTGQELAIIIDQGVAGELTRDTKPTASAIFGWMSAYMNGDARKEALRDYRRNLRWHGQQDGPSPENVAELNRQAEVRALQTLWAEFKDLGHFAADHLDGYIAMACDAFMKRGYMQVTDEHWAQARAAARKEAQRALGSSWIDRALPYDPIFRTKRIMLAMCFRGLVNAGYELTVNA